MTGYYWGTTGWQDIAARSRRERAIRDAQDGALAKRLDKVLAFAASMGTVGVSIPEAQKELDLGSYEAMQAVANLHNRGELFRLTEYKRGHSVVYIHPNFADRFTEAEFSRMPTETAMDKLKRQAKAQEITIRQLIDEISHLKRRLGES